MKKSELKDMIGELIEEKLEEFFINDLPDIVSEVVSKKLSKLLKEDAPKKLPLKERILSSYEEMEELTFGSRGDNVKEGVRQLTRESAQPTNVLDKSKQIKPIPVKLEEIAGDKASDIDLLAGLEYDDSLLGIKD